MRMYVAALVLASSIATACGWLLPVSAQDHRSTHALPSTQLGDDNAAARSGRQAAPGFAHARVAENPDAPEARMVGQATCTGCHARETEHFAHTTHALGMNVAYAADPATPTCEACHGPGSLHAQQPTRKGTIIAFTHQGGTDVQTQADACLGCHQGGPRNHWLGSVHQRNDVSCSDCHNPMSRSSAEGLQAQHSINDTCATCHQDIRQQFNQRSHMPLSEGQMTCVDCHNPHGSINATLLKTDTVNKTCYQCHAEKRGPFLWEHAPARESCLNCHTPHGSNQHALLVAPVPMLCQQCHSHTRHPNDLFTEQQLASGATPDERLMGRGCLTCHAQIHGSNHPAGPRLHK